MTKRQRRKAWRRVAKARVRFKQAKREAMLRALFPTKRLWVTE